MRIELTNNEATHLILKNLGLESTYRADGDILITTHKVVLTDGKDKE